MSILRLVVGAGLFAFGYYLGRQSGRMEVLHGEFPPYNEEDPISDPDNSDREKSNTDS